MVKKKKKKTEKKVELLPMNRKTYLATNWNRILLRKMRNDSNRLKKSILTPRKIIAIALKNTVVNFHYPANRLN